MFMRREFDDRFAKPGSDCLRSLLDDRAAEAIDCEVREGQRDVVGGVGP
jgi:hypothetical protein